ncbi:FUSC family protein [Intestinimonas massiliensis (ex Afouda et al. 2020)]|uniref:FUSC family protein n=1 Tax=Intestinimonas massiliensis (ex Afouda et al. 2020) TaxID=1673721 RepID=UPI001F5F01EF|nr:FUSC family protein [Intestinimonas massiliensis (ex Afouda et al. 2020)]
MAALSTLRGFPSLFRSRLKEALPTILFYMIQFVLVTLIFGQRSVMVVSCSTTLFQIRRKQYNTGIDYARMFFVSLLLCLLAYVATRNVVLCIVLNMAVPVFLVFWKSSQFAPKGYLGFAMAFVFLELRPPTPEEFPTQFLAAVFCFAMLIPALALYARIFRRVPDPVSQIDASLVRLSQLLELLARDGNDAAVRKELYDTAQKFHRLGYDRRHLFHLPDKQKRYYHLFALLFQRASYLVTDEAAWQEARETPAFPEVMDKLSGLVRRLHEAGSHADLEALAGEIQGLLDHSILPQGRLRIFARSVMHMLLLLCREPLSPSRRSSFRAHAWRDWWTGFRQRLSPDSFEFRFALRLAVVLTVSCTVSFLWEFEHTYWFPLHAFLLLQPSYEESTHRMVTRPIGTAIGCVLVHLVYPYLPGLPGVFVFSLVMIALMYCCTPGTWVHPIFSTSFALTMATLTVEETEAIQLRLLYLAMAVALVLVVNRFLLPSRKDLQFRRNLRALFYLQSVYWGVVQRSLREPVEPALYSELLSQFHMVYHEVSAYIAQLPPEEGASYRTLQLTLWNMFSELEQVECLIQTGALSPSEYPPLDELANQIRTRLAPPQAGLAQLSEDSLTQSELKGMVERYLQNARLLLTCLPKA